ncbi:MAG TPA: STAS domain-containing protein [Gemmata sp.]
MLGDAPVRADHDDRPGWSRLVLTGRVTVAVAREFHATASDLLARGNSIAVRCDGAEHLDTSAIQILLCLARELVSRGKRFDLGGVSPELGAGLQLAGLANAAGS